MATAHQLCSVAKYTDTHISRRSGSLMEQLTLQARLLLLLLVHFSLQLYSLAAFLVFYPTLALVWGAWRWSSTC